MALDRKILLVALLLGCAAAGIAWFAMRSPQEPAPAPAAPDIEAPAKPATPAKQKRGAVAFKPKIKDVTYATRDGRSLRLDLYRSKTAAPPYPLILWIHGGGWRQGDKHFTIAKRMTKRGYAVASVDYRLSGEAVFPAQIHDVKAAVSWLRANADRYNLAAEKIGVWGTSSGAHLAALLGTTSPSDGLEDPAAPAGSPPTRVQAVCAYYPISDLARIDGTKSPEKFAKLAEMIDQFIGATGRRANIAKRRASPIKYVTKDDPPFLIIHGDEDETVPVYQSRVLHKALRAKGVASSFHIEHGVGHNAKQYETREIHKLVDEFFDSSIRGPEPDASAE